MADLISSGTTWPNCAMHGSHPAAQPAVIPALWFSPSMRGTVSTVMSSGWPQYLACSGTNASMICLAVSASHPATWSPVVRWERSSSTMMQSPLTGSTSAA